MALQRADEEDEEAREGAEGVRRAVLLEGGEPLVRDVPVVARARSAAASVVHRARERAGIGDAWLWRVHLGHVAVEPVGLAAGQPAQLEVLHEPLQPREAALDEQPLLGGDRAHLVGLGEAAARAVPRVASGALLARAAAALRVKVGDQREQHVVKEPVELRALARVEARREAHVLARRAVLDQPRVRRAPHGAQVAQKHPHLRERVLAPLEALADALREREDDGERDHVPAEVGVQLGREVPVEARVRDGERAADDRVEVGHARERLPEARAHRQRPAARRRERVRLRPRREPSPLRGVDPAVVSERRAERRAVHDERDVGGGHRCERQRGS